MFNDSLHVVIKIVLAQARRAGRHMAFFRLGLVGRHIWLRRVAALWRGLFDRNF